MSLNLSLGDESDEKDTVTVHIRSQDGRRNSEVNPTAEVYPAIRGAHPNSDREDSWRPL